MTRLTTIAVFFASWAICRAAAPERDWHSAANPEHVRVVHLDLDLTADFDKKQLRGTATLAVERTSKDMTQPLVFDTRGLLIESTETSTDGQAFAKADFTVGKADKLLGQSLTIPLPEKVKAVRVTYATGPNASALQWLAPSQTVGRKRPYLFTQSQAIEARSWIPLQDTPAVRITYTARIRTPKELLAVMSVANDPRQPRTGDYRFEMKQAIPPYLMALAIGDLEFRPLGPRTGVYSEPAVVAKAAAEFADVEAIVEACEKLYGPYRWERYDLLIMPPSFPYGGMENPRLTFASPTALAGDKSMVSLVAHELAHSWSGNLVSNATWRNFWLNEGFTVYLERRIMETVYGPERAEAEAMMGRRSLERELAELPKPDQILHVDLKNRPPFEGLTDVPYEKGALFLKHLETIYGRERFDAFLKGYFDHFAFRSIRTEDFAKYLDEHLLKADAAKAAKANVKEWLFEPGLPKDAPNPQATAMVRVELLAASFAKGDVKAADLPAKGWSLREWIAFLNALPADVGAEKLKALDDAFQLSASGNSFLLATWLQQSIQNNYAAADAKLEQFLIGQGRIWYLQMLYKALAKTPAGKERAKAIFEKARANYHPAAVEAVEAILATTKSEREKP